METFNLDEGRLMTREEFIRHVWDTIHPPIPREKFNVQTELREDGTIITTFEYPQQRPVVFDLDTHIHYPIYFFPKVVQ